MPDSQTGWRFTSAGGQIVEAGVHGDQVRAMPRIDRTAEGIYLSNQRIIG